MKPLLSSEINDLRRQIEKQKAQNWDIFRHIERVPDPMEFGEAMLGNTLDAWQQDYMKECRFRSRIAIAACRQTGKSTVTGLFVAWCMIFIPGFQCLIASRSLRQASHYLNSVREAVLAVTPRDAIPVLNRLSIELANGSSAISIPCAQPDAGRGFSPHLVILDEAAFAPEALFRAITPSLSATAGAMHMLSSPNGRQGYFFDAFEGESQDAFYNFRVTHRECPRITDETVRLERAALGDLYFRQEFEAEFITPQGAFFGFSALQNLEEGEDPDLSDLELLDMEDLLETTMPVPEPTSEDMKVAFDRTQRVRQMLVD
jgi:hypothetical protein